MYRFVKEVFGETGIKTVEDFLQADPAIIEGFLDERNVQENIVVLFLQWAPGKAQGKESIIDKCLILILMYEILTNIILDLA